VQRNPVSEPAAALIVDHDRDKLGLRIVALEPSILDGRPVAYERLAYAREEPTLELLDGRFRWSPTRQLTIESEPATKRGHDAFGLRLAGSRCIVDDHHTLAQPTVEPRISGADEFPSLANGIDLSGQQWR
jgi:hypothetical protein